MDYGLERECPICKKSGFVVNPKLLEWSLNDSKYKKPDKDLIVCPVCNGSTYVLTGNGLEILNLIDKYER